VCCKRCRHASMCCAFRMCVHWTLCRVLASSSMSGSPLSHAGAHASAGNLPLCSITSCALPLFMKASFQTLGLSQRLRALFALRPESGALEPGAKQLLELHFNAGGALQSAMALAACADLTIPIREPLTGRTEVVLPLRVSLRAMFSRWAPARLAQEPCYGQCPQSLEPSCLLLTVQYRYSLMWALARVRCRWGMRLQNITHAGGRWRQPRGLTLAPLQPEAVA
jgi:hypothetical protein